MTKPQILIIEDNPADVELLRMALDQQGEPYELTVLTDGAEALAYVYGRQRGVREPEPCAMLLEVHLPKYDGLEVLSQIRREPSLRHIQVVMLAAGPVRPEVESRIHREGAIFRAKPRQLSEVMELAAEVLRLCKSALSPV